MKGRNRKRRTVLLSAAILTVLAAAVLLTALVWSPGGKLNRADPYGLFDTWGHVVNCDGVTRLPGVRPAMWTDLGN